MPEGQVVHKTETPVTVESLQADFEVLGIEKGMTLLVHSSLSAMGWVCGGPVAVIIALQEVLGETGTLVNTRRLPEFTTCTVPSCSWFRPAPGCWALKQYVHTSRRIPGRLSKQTRRPRGCPYLTGGFKGMAYL